MRDGIHDAEFRNENDPAPDELAVAGASRGLHHVIHANECS